MDFNFQLGSICLTLLGPGQSVSAENLRFGPNDSLLATSTVNDADALSRQRAHGDAWSALLEFAQRIDAERPRTITVSQQQDPHHRFDDEAFVALRAFAQQIGAAPARSSGERRVRVAEADSLFDALREFLQRGGGSPGSTPNPPPAERRRAAPAGERPAIDASFVGGKTCLTCHASQAEAFGRTLMGRIARVQPGKLDCESCHGPGSAHVRDVGCAACHGETGISKRPGMPSLVGLDPQYLVSSMKAYVTGQRKHELMKAMLARLGDAELNNIALYYARQAPARAQTPLIGDPAAGKAASASCVACHGAEGVSANPIWPSLAGQDAQYLAAAMKAYKDGSRADPVMRPFVAGLDTRTINNIASYYASLRPARPSLPESARSAPIRATPVVLGRTASADGRSVGGIISFRPNDPGRTAEENNAVCLACHDKGNRTLWQGSSHETRGIACTNCHTVMKDISRKHQLKTAFEPDTCFQCHKNKRAEMWRTAHMPVREGKMSCTSCHNPHGSFSEALLKQATVNDNCYQCHAEKRGPFLWEHAPVRENCLNCHDPHGSTNDFMLKISRPRLCQQCHIPGTGHPGNPRNPFSVFAINRECQNCHSQHHGSNSPSGARFQR